MATIVATIVGVELMKFVTVRDLRGKTSELWEKLSEEKELVVTSSGKPIAILSATDEASLESCLKALRSERAREALSRLQRDARERNLSELTDGEIQDEIRASRVRRLAD